MVWPGTCGTARSTWPLMVVGTILITRKRHGIDHPCEGRMGVRALASLPNAHVQLASRREARCGLVVPAVAARRKADRGRVASTDQCCPVRAMPLATAVTCWASTVAARSSAADTSVPPEIAQRQRSAVVPRGRLGHAAHPDQREWARPGCRRNPAKLSRARRRIVAIAGHGRVNRSGHARSCP